MDFVGIELNQKAIEEVLDEISFKTLVKEYVIDFHFKFVRSLWTVALNVIDLNKNDRLSDCIYVYQFLKGALVCHELCVFKV